MTLTAVLTFRWRVNEFQTCSLVFFLLIYFPLLQASCLPVHLFNLSTCPLIHSFSFAIIYYPFSQASCPPVHLFNSSTCPLIHSFSFVIIYYPLSQASCPPVNLSNSSTNTLINLQILSNVCRIGKNWKGW